MVSIIVICLIVIALIVFAVVLARSGIFAGGKGLRDGMRYEAQGRYHEALAAYDKVMQRANITPELRWKVANLCIKLNLISRAQKELNILLSTKNYPANVSVEHIKAARAAASIAAGNERDAFYELSEVMRITRKIPTVYRDLGYIYCHQGVTMKGIGYLEKYLQNVPNDQEAMQTLGIAYLDAGNANKALAALERAIRIKTPETGDIYYYLGMLYLGSKKIPQALQTLGHVPTKKCPAAMISDAHRLMAIAYKEKGQPDEAIVSYGKAIDTAKNNIRDTKTKTCMYNQAVLYVQTNDLKKAESNFSQLLMLDPGFLDTRIALDAVRGRIANNPSGYVFKFHERSIINSVLMKGLLYSRSRFDLDAFERDVQKQLDKKDAERGGSPAAGAAKSAGASLTVEKLNAMDVRNFKETAKKIIASVGYNIQSDVRFPGDHDYMDGNAVNYMVTSAADSGKGNGGKVFSIRRVNEEVDKMSISNFLDWIDEKSIPNAVYVVTNNYDRNAVPIMQKHPNVKFIDQNGLSKMLLKVK